MIIQSVRNLWNMQSASELTFFFVHYRIHICVTLMHTKNGLADKFLDDVKANVEELMKNPKKPVEGKVSGLAWFYLQKIKTIDHFRWLYTVLLKRYLIDRLSVNLPDDIWIPHTTLRCQQSKRTDAVCVWRQLTELYFVDYCDLVFQKVEIYWICSRWKILFERWLTMRCCNIWLHQFLFSLNHFCRFRYE